MAYDDRYLPPETGKHSLTVEGRRKMVLSGVLDVESFDEAEVVMLTTGGNLIIRGSGMHMGKLDLEAGEARIEGLISELCYEEVAASGSLWARLFH